MSYLLENMASYFPEGQDSRSEEETDAYIFHCVDHQLAGSGHSRIMLLLAEHPVAFINDSKHRQVH